MADPTLTLAASGSTDTLHVTALTEEIPDDEYVFVDAGETTVERMQLSAPGHVGALTLSVVTQTLAHTHDIGAVVMPKFRMTGVGRTLGPINTPVLRGL